MRRLIDDESDFERVRGEKVAVVEFSAEEWCDHCQKLAPIMDELSYEIGDAPFYNVDVDECPNVAQEFGIEGIPFVAVMKNGEITASSVGFKPKVAMKSFIDENL